MEWKQRKSGILLHPTSLPGKYGIGTLGKEAYQFIDFLILSGQKIWQTCPLGPTGYGDSPYQSFSAFAGNPLLIDLEILCDRGYLSIEEITPSRPFDELRVEFGAVIQWKFPLLEKAYQNFIKKSNPVEKEAFSRFQQKNRLWLDDYALFMSLKDHFGGKSWSEWDDEIRLRKPKVVEKYRNQLFVRVEYYKYLQYEFFRQWKELKLYANLNDITIIGDIPLYISFDSSDAWASPESFLLDENRMPIQVAGVPPDYFSETGQLWGNPIYDWQRMKSDGFQWWIRRIEANLEISDVIRFDHFLGLSAYWSIPYGETTAIQGEWVKAPGVAFFQALMEHFGNLPFLAEDLGVVTKEVVELREMFGLPGMKILQFAFESDESSSESFIPYVYPQNCAVYTGTHDNDTIIGWSKKAKPEDLQYAKDYLGVREEEPLHFAFIKGAWSSTAMFAIAQMQDFLGLGTEARMNLPGTASGNWQWRYRKEMITEEMIKELKRLTILYGR